MKVKICGNTTERDIRLCADAGADALGFVVEYPVDVPWNLNVERAAALIEGVPEGVLSFMVTGGGPEQVVSRAEKVRPNAVQLHHEETLAEVADMAKRLKELGISTVKALRIDDGGRLKFEIANMFEAAGELEKTGVAAFLLDSFTPARPGGTGRPVGLETYLTLRKSTALPVILAGGLKPGNLETLVPMDCPPCMLDVLSGVESSPGIKDANKVAAFVKAARSLKVVGQ